jgi:hypothetical protein
MHRRRAALEVVMSSLCRLVPLTFVLLSLCIAGCGSDACEEAAAKLETCGVDVGEPKDSSSCTGESECVAECVIDFATCDDLSTTLAEASPDFRDCFIDCVGDPND